jgi:hypothetical protein
MTVNDPDPNRYPDNNPRYRGARSMRTTWALIALVAVLVTGGIVYTFATSDRNHTQAVFPPPIPTTTGSTPR